MNLRTRPLGFPNFDEARCDEPKVPHPINLLQRCFLAMLQETVTTNRQLEAWILPAQFHRAFLAQQLQNVKTLFQGNSVGVWKQLSLARELNQGVSIISSGILPRPSPAPTATRIPPR